MPPAYNSFSWGGDGDVVWTVRVLSDIGLLTSYLILVWSEWELLSLRSGFYEMQVSVREDFEGIEMGCHRAEPIQRLDYILGELDRLSQHLDVRSEAENL